MKKGLRSSSSKNIGKRIKSRSHSKKKKQHQGYDYNNREHFYENSKREREAIENYQQEKVAKKELDYPTRTFNISKNDNKYDYKNSSFSPAYDNSRGVSPLYNNHNRDRSREPETFKDRMRNLISSNTNQNQDRSLSNNREDDKYRRFDRNSEIQSRSNTPNQIPSRGTRDYND